MECPSCNTNNHGNRTTCKECGADFTKRVVYHSKTEEQTGKKLEPEKRGLSVSNWIGLAVLGVIVLWGIGWAIGNFSSSGEDVSDVSLEKRNENRLSSFSATATAVSSLVRKDFPAQRRSQIATVTVLANPTVVSIYEGANHFFTAHEKIASFNVWHNTLFDRADEDPPNFDEWVGQLMILDEARNSAKQVPAAWLNLMHPELLDTWQGLFIPFVEEMYYYYYTVVYSPEKIQEMNISGSLVSIDQLEEAYADWYESNFDDLMTEINKPR